MDQTQQDIAKLEAIEQEITVLSKEAKEYKEQLKRAIAEKEPADLRANLQSLLDYANAELADRRKEKDLLMKEKTKLTSSLNQHEGGAADMLRVHSRFSNPATILMTPAGLSDWLTGSPTSSSSELTGNEVLSQQEINANDPIQFPLAGRDESLKFIADCFSTVFQNRRSDDRNQRPIPICTGVPGLGKTRLLKECASTVLGITRIPGKRLSSIISFGNDGNAYGWVDESLGIECSFAWRVLHSLFKAQYSYESWMRDKSPANRKLMTLDMALQTIEEYWSKKTNDNILVFVGVDEYQKLDLDNLEKLLGALCNCSRVPVNSRLTLFSMLAGTDLNKTRIARTSFPNTKRVPIRFLNHSESMEAIGPYISNVHPGFVASESFAHNVYFLGGVPRLLTKFAEKVSEMKLADLVENSLRSARMAVLSYLQFPQLSVSDLLKLLAISFTNTSVNNILICPFKESTMESARSLNWSQMGSIGMCLIQDDGCVIVPFHLVSQVLDRQLSEGATLGESEVALISSLKDMSDNVGIPLHNVPAWLSWESFGAHFYCVRMNSFLVLGQSVLPLSDILRGSRFREDDPVFKTQVQIRVAKVFHSNEQYGPDMPRLITRNKASYISVDWVDDSCLQVVLNGDDGAGVDIFFALKRADNSGHILLLDQRKRLGSDVTGSVLSGFMAKIPEKPRFLNSQTVESTVGLMSIYSSISVEPVP
ncbi:hypothetical protein MP638_006133 [Amoeboaphelidium occidentale]|nr:hypothetical protein MP638_006133 [Amoeboaphelidium occidentale]